MNVALNNLQWLIYYKTKFTKFIISTLIHTGRTCLGFIVGHIVIYKVLCFNVAQGQINGAPNETRTHSCRFARPACKPLHHQRCPIMGHIDLFKNYLY